MYQIRLIEARSRQSDITHLLSRCFGENISPEQFEWKCVRNPLGPSLAWIATDGQGDEIVGIQIMHFREFNVRGKRCKVIQLSDGAVHPAYRGKGIFTKLLSSAIGTVKQEDAAFGFSFPNELSAPAFRKYSFIHEIYSGRQYVRPLGAGNVSSRLFRGQERLRKVATPLLEGIIRTTGYMFRKRVDLERLGTFTSNCEDWASKSLSSHSIYPVRSKEFLEWKGCLAPATVMADLERYWVCVAGRQVGYIVLSRDRKRNMLKVIDCAVEDPARRLTLTFETILRVAWDESVDVVTMNVSGKAYQKALRSAGFFGGNRYRVSVIDINGVFSNKKKTVDAMFLSAIDRDNYYY